ncbi:MAG: hypothetical protein ACOX4U_00495 [Anaerovoracaceae bacterium]|jgi:hypothetical protein
MALLDLIKKRIPVYHDARDDEVQSMIGGAISYFAGAGWEIDALAPTPLSVEAITLYCKMAQSTDVKDLSHHPVLLSFIGQGRRGDAGPVIVFPEKPSEDPQEVTSSD